MLIRRPHVGPSVTVLARSSLPPAVALARMAAYPIPAMFVGDRVFPAVERVEPEVDWDHVGAHRVHHLADGGTVAETIVEWTPGSSFAYELVGFTDVFGRFVHGLRGEWSAAPDGDGSILRWTWEFAPLPFRRGLMAWVVGPLWRRYSQRMITTVTAEISAVPVSA